MTARPQSLAAGAIAAAMTAVGGSAVLLATAPALGSDASAELMTPGGWEIVSAIEELEIPGLPASMVEKMAKDPKNAQPRSACLTPDSEQRPQPAMFHTLGGTCSYTKWDASGGTLEAELACTPPSGSPGTAKVTLKGSYTADSFNLASQTIGEDETGEMQLRLISQLTGRRTGGCS
ncbi:MAG: DUF3617 domain-containing protein [Erythrobacter sp.]